MKTTPALYNKFMRQFVGLPCEKTGIISESNQPHHVIYKSQSRLLTLVKLNICVLTVEEHAIAHRSKPEFLEWFENKYHGRLEKLRDIEREIRKFNMTPEEIYNRWGT
jgi:hypothetical protein